MSEAVAFLVAALLIGVFVFALAMIARFGWEAGGDLRRAIAAKRKSRAFAAWLAEQRQSLASPTQAREGLDRG